MNLTRFAFIVFALILLGCSGCSMVKVGYNHADWILRYWINDYTSFNEVQRQEIRRDVDEYMRWHRRHALPEYIAFLKEVDATASQEAAVGVEDVMRLGEEMVSLYRLTATPTIRPAAYVLSTLDDAQVEELRETLAKKDRELREELLAGSEREMLARRARNQVKFVENMVGSLSSEQEGRIVDMSLRVPFITRDYLDHREARQAELISLLRNHAGEERIAALFTLWMEKPQAQVSSQEQQTLAAYDSAMNEMVVGIVASLTAEQKRHLHHKLADYIDDLQTLHAAADAAAPVAPPLR